MFWKLDYPNKPLKNLEFKPCRKMPVSWRTYILNAFDIRLSNGFTEGYNNAIKALKRLAFGFRNFAAFRAKFCSL